MISRNDLFSRLASDFVEENFDPDNYLMTNEGLIKKSNPDEVVMPHVRMRTGAFNLIGTIEAFGVERPVKKPKVILFKDGTFRTNHQFRGNVGEVRLSSQERDLVFMEITSNHFIYHIDPGSLVSSLNFALKKFAYTYSEPVEESTIESVGITNIGDYLLRDMIVSDSSAFKTQAALLDASNVNKDDKVIDFLEGRFNARR